MSSCTLHGRHEPTQTLQREVELPAVLRDFDHFLQGLITAKCSLTAHAEPFVALLQFEQHSRCSPSVVFGNGGNSTSMRCTPSATAADTDFDASRTSSANELGLYVLRPLAAAGDEAAALCPSTCPAAAQATGGPPRLAARRPRLPAGAAMPPPLTHRARLEHGCACTAEGSGAVGCRALIALSVRAAPHNEASSGHRDLGSGHSGQPPQTAPGSHDHEPGPTTAVQPVAEQGSARVAVARDNGACAAGLLQGGWIASSQAPALGGGRRSQLICASTHLSTIHVAG